MADPSAQREVIQHNQGSNPFNSAASLTLPTTQPACHYSPHVYVDPVTASFYQRHPAQRHVSQSPTNPQLQSAVSHPQQAPLNSSHPPYYIPDMTAVALQQIQLQTMLQLQAQQAHNQQSNHPSHETHTSQQQQIPPHHTTATSHTSLPGILPVPAHITRALTVNSSAIPPTLAISQSPIPPSAALPIVPEAQMASAYRIGRYTPAERKIRLERYREKRAQRNYNRRVKYDCRKQIADKRRRVQGRFVKREEEIALAATETGNDHRNSEATDATEDETKLQQPESSASGSSTRHPDVNVRATSTNDRSNRQQPSFCEQSDHILQTFR